MTAGPAPAQADDVVYYERTHNMSDVTTFTLQGALDADGICQLPEVSLELDNSQVAVAAHQMSLNKTTCEATFEMGTPSAEEIAEADADAGALIAADAITDADLGGAVINSQGYFKSWYEDPIGIDVTSVLNRVNWNWDGVCTRGRANHSTSWGWFEASGWRLDARDFDMHHTCARAWNDTFANYFNGAFCINFDTRTIYDRNLVQGQWNGWLKGQVRAFKRGGCTDLLSFHFMLRREKN